MDNMEWIQQIMRDPGIAKQVLAALSQSEAQRQVIETPQIEMPTYSEPEVSMPSMPQAAGQASQLTQPTQTPPIQPSVQSGAILTSNGQINPLIQKYFPQEQWANAQAVMNGESGGNPQAVGDNFPIRGETIPSYGLFQIRALPGRPDPKQLLDPEFNVKYAADMWKNQGWGPWTAARKLGLV